MLIILNIIILSALFLLLLAEERRYRMLARRVTETGKELTLIAHQMRSPLSDLRKYQEFLQSKEFGALTFAQQEALSKAGGALSESVVLLDRLLARSRLEEGRLTAEASVLRLRENTIAVMNAVRPLAERKKQRFVLSGETSVQVFADPLLVHGVLDEIVSNAVHYTPEGGDIRVHVKREKGRATVTVTDTGIGMSARELPHIFQKFFRGERAKKMAEGNGLGLAFAKEFAEQSHGTLTCTSSEKHGTSMKFSLPLSRKRPVRNA